MIEDVDIHLGRRLRGRRRNLDLTQQDIGSVCGVRFQQIQKYECAANRMSAAMLWKIACALSVDVQFFFEGLASLRPPTPPSGLKLQPE